MCPPHPKTPGAPLQLFAGKASSTNFSNFGTAYFGGTATSSFDSVGALIIRSREEYQIQALGWVQLQASPAFPNYPILTAPKARSL